MINRIFLLIVLSGLIIFICSLSCKKNDAGKSAKQIEQIMNYIYVNSETFSSQNSDTSKMSGDILEHIFAKATNEDWKSLNIGERMIMVGKEFVGTPYIGYTLEYEPENCIVNLSGLDCVTFFESVLNISRMIKMGKSSYQDLVNAVTFTRYRNGKLTDYTSRLHYTGEWIMDNIKKGIVKDITKDIGGELFNVNVNYMSTHPKSYIALKNNTSFVSVIAGIEKEINKNKFYYIPKEKIQSIENKLEDGDIIAFATNLSGMDYVHIGIVYVDEKGQRRLMHASSVKKQVVIDKAIHEYIAPIKKDIGITILRAID